MADAPSAFRFFYLRTPATPRGYSAGWRGKSLLPALRSRQQRSHRSRRDFGKLDLKDTANAALAQSARHESRRGNFDNSNERYASKPHKTPVKRLRVELLPFTSIAARAGTAGRNGGGRVVRPIMLGVATFHVLFHVVITARQKPGTSRVRATGLNAGESQATVSAIRPSAMAG